jgi:hypothetical protein
MINQRQKSQKLARLKALLDNRTAPDGSSEERFWQTLQKLGVRETPEAANHAETGLPVSETAEAEQANRPDLPKGMPGE